MSDIAQASFNFPDLPGLGSGWELLLPREETSRRCTGEVAACHEELRVGILKACVHLGTRRAAEAFGVSREVVRALRAEAIRTGELDRFKEEEGRRCLGMADRLLDRLEDETDRLPLQTVPIAIGILTDKGLLLAGQPTQRIQVDHTLSVADIDAYIASLPSAKPVEPGETAAQKALPDPACALDIPRGMEAPPDLVRDSQSPVSAQAPDGTTAPGTTLGQIGPEKEGAP